MKAISLTATPRRRSSRNSFRMNVSERRGKRLTRMASVAPGSTARASTSVATTGVATSRVRPSGGDTSHAPEEGNRVDGEAVGRAGGVQPTGGQLGRDLGGPATAGHPEQLGGEQVDAVRRRQGRPPAGDGGRQLGLPPGGDTVPVVAGRRRLPGGRAHAGTQRGVV